MKQIFFLKKKIWKWQTKKSSFTSSANSQYFFVKISCIGPLVRPFLSSCLMASRPHRLPMPFASINPTDQRTNPWNFHKKYWELAELENELFLVCHFQFFFQKKICFIPIRTCQSLLVSKDFSKFWWLPWFPAPNSTCLKICNTVYML